MRKHPKPYTLSARGLGVLRLADPESVRPVVRQLQSRFGEVIIVRSYDSNPPAPPRVAVMEQHAVGARRWPDSIDLAPLMDKVVQAVPSLEKPRSIRFTAQNYFENHSNRPYLTLVPDDHSFAETQAEYSAVANFLDKEAGTKHGWNRPPEDVVFAVGELDTELSVLSQVGRYLASIVPIEIEFCAASFKPDLPQIRAT
ncbi:MAG TPA: hypothetical protein VLA92_01350 [Candidatus Saccharimonadales bacterium]|nr:hypothetical protein [Candidatus Saccharimonadales bacterium]